ncbi:penicillin-insensitive murein endopeptidase [Pseudochrobactrum sp. sp1633]|uniref:penicillin-insensitive murein endopeptidase n=1 Tax=Pseudochrobactrum sp. sp1633 TaxID=3036706 RepID=UPI0025A50406|nr:penicillin-insensitive murein endopeptidase [Pseudochrobactrum sp. sp1633]MDM8345939.1 penicillin-insensitive murein endopeptidase [Pseudochrobactrum sp. sp1633]HWD12198.1 penicillin-insensitive murein endopeptidase [Pseudochrobactrum sp.]
MTFARKLCAIALSLSLTAPLLSGAVTTAQADAPAKQAFGSVKLPNVSTPESYGFYSKGCISGAVALPVDGQNWQVMRLSRNRNWGHPNLIALLEKLSRDAAKTGWNGLLVGDISQPRGGPMLTGHASHQVGLDADIWLTPMPNRRFTNQEREDVSAVSMLQPNSLYVDQKKWTASRTALLKHAASYPQVERLFVHPGIKKQLCETVSGDRSWLAKVRPYWGHFYHFHVRLRCQAGSPDCKPQEPTGKDDGCGKSLDWWFTDEPWKPAKPAKPGEKPKPPKVMMVSQLPSACAALLNAPTPASVKDVTYGLKSTGNEAETFAPAQVPAFAAPVPPASIPLPAQKP